MISDDKLKFIDVFEYDKAINLIEAGRKSRYDDHQN